MNNVLPYCGLVDVRIDASDKDLPVQFNKKFQWLKWYVHDITIPPETYRKRPPETDITTPSNLLPSTSSTSTRIDANLLDLKPSEVSSKT